MQPPCLESLERSHVRHAEVVRDLVAAARRLAADPRGRTEAQEMDDLDQIGGAIDYFHRSVPRHFRDEEESLFPRLGQRLPERAAELAQLIAEHPGHLALHQRITEAFEVLGQRRLQRVLDGLLATALELERAYEDHAHREDALFAEAATALTARDLEEIGEEMERRRGRSGGGRGGGGMGSGSGGGGGGRGRGGMGGGGGGRRG